MNYVPFPNPYAEARKPHHLLTVILFGSKSIVDGTTYVKRDHDGAEWALKNIWWMSLKEEKIWAWMSLYLEGKKGGKRERERTGIYY